MTKIVALVLLLPAATFAADLFDGTWKTRLESVRISGKPEVFELGGGIFECKSCVPPYKVKTDGTDQAVRSEDYRDHAAVNILSAARARWP